MEREPAEKAKRVAALFGALLCHAEEIAYAPDSRAEEEVAVLAAVLRLLRQKTTAVAGRRSPA